MFRLMMVLHIRGLHINNMPLGTSQVSCLCIQAFGLKLQHQIRHTYGKGDVHAANEMWRPTPLIFAALLLPAWKEHLKWCIITRGLNLRGEFSFVTGAVQGIAVTCFVTNFL